MGKISLKGSNGKLYYGWLVVLCGFMCMTIGYTCAVSVVGVFVLPVVEDLQLQIGDFTSYLTCQSVVAVLSLIVVSKYFTEKSIRKIMLIAAFLGIAGFVGFACATTLWHFYVASAGIGFCFACMTATPCTILLNNWFGERIKGVALSLIFGGSSVGAMLMISILNRVVQATNWRIGYGVIAACLLLICVPCLLAFTAWSPEKKGVEKMGEKEEETLSQDSGRQGIAFKDAKKKPLIWMFFLSCILIVIASSSILTHTQTFLVLNGYSPTFAGNIVSVMIGLLILGSILVGAYCDRGSIRFAAIATCLIFAVGFIAQIYIPQAGWLMIILILGYAFGCPAVNIVSPLVVKHAFGEKDFGVIVGYSNASFTLGAAIGAPIIGKLLDLTGTYTASFWFCAVVLLIAAIIRAVATSNKNKFTLN